MKIFAEDDSLEDLHNAELERLKLMLDGGSPIAVPAAIYFCHKYKLDFPEWLVRACARTSCSLPVANAAKGAFARMFSRYRKDMDHYDRWCAVDEVLEARKFIQTEVEGLGPRPGQALPGIEAREALKQAHEKLKELGTANEDAFECASEILGGTRAKNGPDVVKKSYQRIERARREAENGRSSMMRYYLLPSEFLRVFSAAQESKQIKIRS